MQNCRVPLGTSTSSRRVWVGVAGSALVVVITAVLLPFRDDVTSATPALVLVVPCVLAALVGGRAVGLAVAVFAAGAFNLVFLEPFGTFKVASVDEAIALVVFGLVALTVATLVAREGERRRAAVQRTIEVEALWKENATMQAEQARLAAEKQALEAIDLQRSALLRSVSHDLRTPLAAIRAVVSDLRDEVLYDAAARQELLELVADEAERLDRLVQNLLSMSRIEAGSLQPERQAVAIDELLDNRVQRLRRLLRDATVTVQADPGSASRQRRLHDGRTDRHQSLGERQSPRTPRLTDSRLSQRSGRLHRGIGHRPRPGPRRCRRRANVPPVRARPR